jgi:rubrerythrin
MLNGNLIFGPKEEKYREIMSGVADHGTLVKRIKESCKAVGEGSNVEITSGNETFDEKLSLGFKSLCAELKKRKQRNHEGMYTATLEKLEPTKKRGKNNPKESKPQSIMVDESIVIYDKEMKGQNSVSTDCPKSSSSPSKVECIESANLSGSSESNSGGSSHISVSCHAYSSDSTVPDSPPTSTQVPLQCDDTRNPLNNLDDSNVKDTTSVALESPENTSMASPMVNHESTHNHKAKRVQSRLLKRNHNTDASLPSTIGPWNCSKCTFFNEALIGSRAKCEICGNPRAKYVV